MNARNESRRIFPQILIILVLSTLLWFSYRELTEWHYFAINEILISGNSRVSEKEILIQAGIEKGTNLVSLNLSAMRKRLLAHPWIEEAQVEWRVPAGVAITIKEERPLAIFDIDRKYIVNVHGKIFKTLAETESDHLPVVEGLKFSDLAISGISKSIAFNTVMNVLTSGKISDCVISNDTVRRVLVDRELGVTLILSPDEKLFHIEEIQLGYEDYPSKYERLRDLLIYLKHQQDGLMIHSVNLSNPDRIVIAPIDAESLDKDAVNEDDKEEV